MSCPNGSRLSCLTGDGERWYRGDGVSVPIWPLGQIGTLTPSPLYHLSVPRH
ncbi:MAG: hypothetical protein FWE41_00460 [Coriobacteriia bacterium]|nr:hypothetical protein [Coriobacteriia bacterium]MCL2750306.1 hypothetical protein [Coriobacteriia bacterium]